MATATLRPVLIAPTTSAWQVITFAEAPLLSAEVALVERDTSAKEKVVLTVPKFGLSLVDDSPQELLYLSAQALHLELESSAAALELQLSLSWLQIDNQLVVTQQPVVHGASRFSDTCCRVTVLFRRFLNGLLCRCGGR